jgi:hypothetical protein
MIHRNGGSIVVRRAIRLLEAQLKLVNRQLARAKAAAR